MSEFHLHGSCFYHSLGTWCPAGTSAMRGKTMSSSESNNKKSESRALWAGRLSETDPLVRKYTCSLDTDRKLALYDIRGSRAHVAMLRKCGHLSEGETDLILEGLDKIEGEIREGSFQFREELEDIHMNIESRLGELTGAAGGKLHTARSRNDQVQLDSRLYMLDAAGLWQSLLVNMIRVLVDKAEHHQKDLFPAWTHMQSAQPMSWGHYFLGLTEMLYRDFRRLEYFIELHDYSPLGAGALSGTSLAVDPDFTAHELGFSRSFSNSYDVVGERDAFLEMLQIATQIMIHLSRFSEDWIYMASTAVSWIELPDEVCTGSSMMPQKKNPDLLELTRGKAATVIGHASAAAVLLKGLPTSYHRDLQQDKAHLFEAAEIVEEALQVMAVAAEGMKPDTAATRNSLEDGFMMATELAEYFVSLGIPFRRAHNLVGKLVKHCAANDCRLEDLPLEVIQEQVPECGNDVYSRLVPEIVLERTAPGSTGLESISKQLDCWRMRLDEWS